MLHEGHHVTISRNFQYMFTFSCVYDLFHFPFDTQECSMRMRLLGPSGCRPVWKTSPGGIQVRGNSSTISMYDISELRFTHDSSKRQVNLKLLFYRRFEAYLLTTFVPCVVLYLLSQLTLTHFRLESFTDRITVTLSLLIVIASLFSQVTASFPSSPVPKFVDCFFLFCIMRVSIVFLLHSTVDVIMRGKSDVATATTTDAATTTTTTGTITTRGRRRGHHRPLHEEKSDKILFTLAPRPYSSAGHVRKTLAWTLGANDDDQDDNQVVTTAPSRPKTTNANKRWCRGRAPLVINWAGIGVLTIADLVVLGLGASWVLVDVTDKTVRFERFNITT